METADGASEAKWENNAGWASASWGVGAAQPIPGHRSVLRSVPRTPLGLRFGFPHCGQQLFPRGVRLLPAGRVFGIRTSGSSRSAPCLRSRPATASMIPRRASRKHRLSRRGTRTGRGVTASGGDGERSLHWRKHVAVVAIAARG